MLHEVQPNDFVKFGLIPEFIGRLPVVVTLDPLDENALIKILTEPKNALVKQYEKMFELDGVSLEFEEKSLTAIAKEAVKRETGARGLRAIIEQAMLEVMFEIPSRTDVDKCVITESVISKNERPLLVREGNLKKRAKGKETA